MNNVPVHARRTAPRRTYPGEAESADLLAWLNANNPSEKKRLAVASVEGVIALVQSLSNAGSEEPRLYQTKLNRALHEYEFVRICKYDTSARRWRFPARPSHDFSKGDWVRGEADAVAQILGLAEMGKLLQVRKCECKRYFFVRFPNRKPPVRFHSKECRERFWEQSEEKKKRDRKLAQARYLSRKELELGSRKAAQRKGGKS